MRIDTWKLVFWEGATLKDQANICPQRGPFPTHDAFDIFISSNPDTLYRLSRLFSFLPLHKRTTPPPRFFSALSKPFMMESSPEPPSSPPHEDSEDSPWASPAKPRKGRGPRPIAGALGSSDDEPARISMRKVRLAPRRSARIAEKLQNLSSSQDETPAEEHVLKQGDDDTKSPHTSNKEIRVTTPPATSPAANAEDNLTIASTATSQVADIEDNIAIAPPAEEASTTSALETVHDDSFSDTSDTGTEWDAGQYGVFDPDDKDFVGHSYDGDIWTCPFAFRDYILEAAMFECNERKFRHHLQDCLRGSAREWYDKELDDQERRELRHGFLEDWLSNLVWRFRPDPVITFELLESNPWTWESVRKNMDIEDWLLAQYAHTEAHGGRENERLQFIWETMSPEMRCDVPEPEGCTTYQDFLKDLVRANEQWRKDAAEDNTQDGPPKKKMRQGI